MNNAYFITAAALAERGFADLPEELNGFRILHLSDLHGAVYGDRQAAFSAALKDVRYACVVMTGDMLGPNGDMQFVEKIKALVDERCSHIWRAAAPEADPGRFELYNAFIINGCIGIIQKWLDTPESSNPEEISQLAATIILASVQPVMS